MGKSLFRSGMIEYKCRRCGAVYSSLHAPDLPQALLDAMFDTGGSGMRATMFDYHQCKDGNLGVSDLLGGVYDNHAD